MISAVSRAMAIMEALASTPNGATASELIEELNIEKSSVSRILATLQEGGYVNCNPDWGVYYPTLKWVALGLRHMDNAGLYKLCLPKLREIADTTGELIQLALAEDESLTFVAKANGRERIRIVSLLGKSAPLHATAVGKVWMASLPEEQALKLALNAGLKAYTQRTITTIDSLHKELSKVRHAGYALNQEELVVGATGIGVPIYDETNINVIGGLVLVAPAFRMSKKRAISFVPTLKQAATELKCLSHLRLSQHMVSGESPEAVEAG